MALIPKAPFPDVPRLPGVPQLPRSPLFPPSTPSPSLGFGAPSGRLWRPSTKAPKWGIYNNSGTRLLVQVDSVLAFDNRNEARLSSYPVQGGSFASYNKVQAPFDIALRLSRSGTLKDRAKFLDSLAQLQANLDLCAILTPERTYRNVNAFRYEVIRRGASGAYFLTDVDIFFQQIQEVTAQYSVSEAATQDAQQPAAQPSVSQGIVQPQPPPPAVVSRAVGGGSGGGGGGGR